jgi:NAD(P)-dependent dehydrogenase (short-subunit alcohol dehydrogenase family)
MKQKTALTTGANSGIGLATAIALAQAGLRSVGSVRSKAKAAQVAEAAKKAGVKVETVLLDVNDAKACAKVIEGLRPDALVNNAGFGTMAAIEDVDDAEARAMLETMVIAPMRLARLALPHMRKSGYGRIVNISSIYGLTTTPLSGWYQAAKHALEGVSDALRIEVASAGIDVVLVEPGGFKTNIWGEMEDGLTSRKDSHYAEAYRRSLASLKFAEPLMGAPEAVAAVITRAVTARRPQPRYLVGYDARLLALVEPVLPTALKDLVSRWTLGL